MGAREPMSNTESNLENHSQCKFVVLAGPSRCGKSRIANYLANEFSDNCIGIIGQDNFWKQAVCIGKDKNGHPIFSEEDTKCTDWDRLYQKIIQHSQKVTEADQFIILEGFQILASKR